MRGIAEVVEVVEEALVVAISADRLLISGGFGVQWNDGLSIWECADSGLTGCDVVGAMLLTQPAMNYDAHRGDAFVAAAQLFEPDFVPDLDVFKRVTNPAFVRARNFLNGWDSEEYLGSDRAAYEAGARLARAYGPVPSSNIEHAVLTAAPSDQTIDIVLLDRLERFYVVEGGVYGFYECVEGIPKLQWRARRVAIAYNSDTLEVFRVGEPDSIMRWAPDFRKRLGEASRYFAISLAPPGHDPIEFNRLMADVSYGITFLRKAGLV